MIYLAAPYSHPEKWVMQMRYIIITQVAAQLVGLGHHIYSPITESHNYAQIKDLPVGWDYWKRHDEHHLGHCEALWVLMLPGWRDSVGVSAEIMIAEQAAIPIVYIKPENYLVNYKKYMK